MNFAPRAFGEIPAEVVLNVWVSPTHRRSGYGVLIYRRVAQMLSDEGKILLSSYSVNDGSKRLWERLASDYPDHVGTTAIDGQTHWYYDVLR